MHCFFTLARRQGLEHSGVPLGLCAGGPRRGAGERGAPPRGRGPPPAARRPRQPGQVAWHRLGWATSCHVRSLPGRAARTEGCETYTEVALVLWTGSRTADGLSRCAFGRAGKSFRRCGPRDAKDIDSKNEPEVYMDVIGRTHNAEEDFYIRSVFCSSPADAGIPFRAAGLRLAFLRVRRGRAQFGVALMDGYLYAVREGLRAISQCGDRVAKTRAARCKLCCSWHACVHA